MFPSHLFERLQDVVSDAGGGRKAFRHAVSGSLRVLNIYRVSAESESSARVDLATLPLLIFAVPNADPPARPVIEVVPEDMTDNGDDYAARVHIKLTPAATQAASWRLRRSSLGATDRLRMPVVSTGAMDAPGPRRQRPAARRVHRCRARADFAGRDAQAVGSLHWVAEAQGDFAPGSVAAGRPVPGSWSLPSEPVSLMLVPPRPPEPAESIVAAGTSVGGGQYVGVRLTFAHPRVLSGGVMRPYRVRITRRKPGAPMEALAEVDIDVTATEVSGMRPGDAADQVPAGTLYRLTIIDPLGRESIAAEATLE